MIFSFQYKEENRFDKTNALIFKMSASKIQRRLFLKPWKTENMIQAIKAICNKEMGYLAAVKI